MLLSPAFAEKGYLISSIASRMVKLSLQQQRGGGGIAVLGGGICPSSAIAFVALASIFYTHGDVEHGTLCEHIGSAIQIVIPDKASRARILVIQNSLSLPRQGFSEELKVAYRLCTDVADSDVSFWKWLENDPELCILLPKPYLCSPTPDFFVVLSLPCCPPSSRSVT
jgi:hypothetical protein